MLQANVRILGEGLLECGADGEGESTVNKDSTGGEEQKLGLVLVTGGAQILCISR